jgi:nitrogen regulatory protein PII
MNKNGRPATVGLMVMILDRGKGEQAAQICKERNLPFHFLCFGLGTAASDLLDYLGLGETKKDVVFSLIPWKDAERLPALLARELQMGTPGGGIAFVMPLSGVSGFVSMTLGNRETDTEGEKRQMNQPAKYELVVAVVNRGFTDRVMDAARSAGATGGTILEARGLSGNRAKFLQISLQEEKTIVAILCERNRKQPIMEAVNRAAGIRTEAGGLLFALAVDSIAGVPD